ncbi:MAG TPA: hypothetical protein VF840_10945, partial [Terriglobales bacterium]
QRMADEAQLLLLGIAVRAPAEIESLGDGELPADTQGGSATASMNRGVADSGFSCHRKKDRGEDYEKQAAFARRGCARDSDPGACPDSSWQRSWRSLHKRSQHGHCRFQCGLDFARAWADLLMH